MQACKELMLNPWCSVLVQEITEVDVEKLKGLVGEPINKNSKITPLYTSAGHPRGQILITFFDKSEYLVFVKGIDKGKATFKDNNLYPCSPVSLLPDDSVTSVPDLSSRSSAPPKGPHVLRTLKPYSGYEKEGKGEDYLRTWIEEAYDAIDDDSLGEDIKLRIVKNSLKGTALSIVNAGSVATAVGAIELVRETFGLSHSTEQLWIDFAQMFQGKTESAAQYWIRLHEALREIARSLKDTIVDENKRRIGQFIFGLTRADRDSLQLHLHLSDMNQEGKYPTFNELLQKLRIHNRNNIERDVRAGNTVQSVQSCDTASKQTSPKRSVEMEVRMRELDQAVADLTSLLESKVNAIQDSGAAKPDPPKVKKKRFRGKPKGKYSGPKLPKLCFKCGEEGHSLAQGCPNQHNPAKGLAAMERWKAWNDANRKSKPSVKQDSVNESGNG